VQVALREGDLDVVRAEGLVDGEAELAGDAVLESGFSTQTSSAKSSDESPKSLNSTIVSSLRTTSACARPTSRSTLRTRSVSEP
jgi:hypothetical protein